jgi:hypothetical protein
MSRSLSFPRPWRVLPWIAVLAGFSAGCDEDRSLPSAPDPLESEAPVPPAVLDTRSSRPGIVFGTFNMRNNYLNTVHTGWMNGGPLDPSNILSWLAGARDKGGRVVIKLCKGKDSYVKNADGTGTSIWAPTSMTAPSSATI